MIPGSSSSQNVKLLKSPSDNIHLNAEIIDSRFCYSVSYNDTTLISPSHLGYVFSDNDSCVEFVVDTCIYSCHDEYWEPLWGQYSRIRNNYNEMFVKLLQPNKNRKLNIRFRTYDDGIAFRYEFPDNPNSLTIMSEETYFNFADDFDSWWIWADYNTYEKLYSKNPISECEHVAVPYTMKTESRVHLCVHEANIDNYSSMTLIKADSLCFKSNLAPWADGTKVKTNGEFVSPWRVVLITDKPGGLIESSLIYNLNEKPVEKDLSWIKPVTYIGIWWEMHLGVSEWGIAGGRHGATTENTLRYIDFAAENNIDAVLIEGWNTGWENWGKPEAFDFVTPYPDYKIKKIARYARKKGVEIIGHHETGGDIIAYENNLEKAFKFYKKLGIKYVKTGYAGPINPPEESHHGQYMINHYNKVMRTAMKYEIMLDVHEPIIPSGLSRTFPNLMSFEGVRGMEWNAWSEGNPPSHTCIIPFTRGLAGPIDYTPAIFDIDFSNSIERKKSWNILDSTKTSVHATISNQIALMLVLYSPLLMAADLIENYDQHPLFEFVKQIPPTWDDTKVLYSEIGEYIVIARRSGEKWFVAGINNDNARDIYLEYNCFLSPDLEYNMILLKDHPLAHYEENPEKYVVEEELVKFNKRTEVRMKEGGGFLIILEPKKIE